jgi:hypothetical protein
MSDCVLTPFLITLDFPPPNVFLLHFIYKQKKSLAVRAAEAKFLDVIGTKVLKVFLLAFLSPPMTDFNPPSPPT